LEIKKRGLLPGKKKLTLIVIGEVSKKGNLGEKRKGT